VIRMEKIGALSDEMIDIMIKKGAILNAQDKNKNPGSLDLTISDEAYRVEGIFQPRIGEKISELLKIIEHYPHDLLNLFEKDVSYLIRLKEKFLLPEDVYGYCNPKSSSGRNDVHVRVLADGVPRYDALVPAGFAGNLWLAVRARSYPIKLFPGETLSQVRFFNQDTRFDEGELRVFLEQHKLLWHQDHLVDHREIKIRDNDGSLILTLDLSSQEIVGYECLGTDRVFDFSRRDYQIEDFFKPLYRPKKHLYLRNGAFYIFSTREAVRVPPDLACEMVPMDERSGEFRSHYAGFIDPGWGYGKNGEGKGRPLTLELRPFENLIVRDNQPISKIRFERMIQPPKVLYDKKRDSHYLDQSGPRLSKQFKKDQKTR